jgi:iron complex transport system permease protein
VRLTLSLLLALVALAAVAIALGETPLSWAQYQEALIQPDSAAGDVLWGLRAPRVAVAALVGAMLGLAGAVLQGLLRNPLADPGILGVSAVSALGAAGVIAAGLGTSQGAVEGAALGGAVLAGALVTVVASRLADAPTLILFGVALSAMGGAATALVFNLSPSPIATTEVLTWLMGSAANRDWPDVALALVPALIGAALCAVSAPGLRLLTLGEETASLSGLPMGAMRAAAVAGASLLTGASVALAGIIGFVGLAAPHLVRGSVEEDPVRVLAPSAVMGALLVVGADLASRLIPTAEELRLGVVAALFGAPLFAVFVWRAGRSWRR